MPRHALTSLAAWGIPWSMHSITPFPCVLPAAGLGSRLAALFTPQSPCKELLPVAGRPVILHALEQAAAAGATTIVVVLRPGKEAIAEVIDQEKARLAPGCEIVTRWQPEPRGEGDAVLHCRDLLDGAPLFGVFYPDNCYQPPAQGDSRPALAILREIASRNGRCTDTLALHRPEQHELHGYASSGRVDMAPHPDCIPGLRLVTRLYEKGPGAFMPRRPGEARACGISVATPAYLDALAHCARAIPASRELTDDLARRRMLADGLPLLAFQLPGQVYDMGTPAGYALTLQHFPAADAS